MSDSLGWIVAVCINQNDKSEKVAQIRIMKMVYTLAEEVIAWLGPTDGSSDGGMAFLNACGEYASTTTELTPGLGRGPISSEECFAELTDLWDGVDEVLARPYWQRTWILQELLFAKKSPVSVWYRKCDLRRSLWIFHRHESTS